MTLSAESPIDLTGKTALVTGGTRGIGLAIAEALGQAGAEVVINGRPGTHADSALTRLQQGGLRTALVTADLLDDAEVAALPDRASAAFGKIDILVNNAGVDPAHSVLETTFETWRQTMRLNLDVPFLLSQALGKGMIERGRGSIVNLSSVLGLTSTRNQCAYVSSKHGLVGMTKAMAVEWGQFGIRVNAIAPGLIETDMSRFVWENPMLLNPMVSRIPMGRIGVVSEIAKVATFLASDAASYINGHTIPVDGGRLAA